ncbi:hypothetical protein [Enterococcus durans]|uniref:hypothetical protein n=1 Tax=Enterococcus durans TaxID=53345 RepID=UPI001EED6162|nr:hypothetical protein [Enterococcus durans]
MNHVGAIQIEIRYRDYIEDRFFNEEVLTNWNPKKFLCAQQTARRIFDQLAWDLQNRNLMVD